MRRNGCVVKVIDGDTFWTRNKIRLARVNAPEINTPRGIKAKRKLEELILGKTVSYEQVGTSYDRLVAEVWVTGKNVNNIMISFLRVLTRPLRVL